MGAIPTIVRLATSDSEPQKTRKLATTALSCTIRNFQPGLDAAIPHLPAAFKPQEAVDAGDMESVGNLIGKLRASY